MEFLPKEIDQYCESNTSPENELLNKINRHTHLHVLQPRMLSGHLQGRLLSMFSHMLKPKNILEIGTYTGYSALCFAEGLPEDGKIISIDNNEELHEMVDTFIQESEYKDKIQTLVGDAMEIIPSLDEKFDLIFIDADKKNYINYFNLVFDKVNVGGYIIADNMLWSGKVLEDESKMDADTKTIVAYNKMLQNDERVEQILLPIRDGLSIARKK